MKNFKSFLKYCFSALVVILIFQVITYIIKDRYIFIDPEMAQINILVALVAIMFAKITKTNDELKQLRSSKESTDNNADNGENDIFRV